MLDLDGEVEMQGKDSGEAEVQLDDGLRDVEEQTPPNPHP